MMADIANFYLIKQLLKGYERGVAFDIGGIRVSTHTILLLWAWKFIHLKSMRRISGRFNTEKNSIRER